MQNLIKSTNTENILQFTWSQYFPLQLTENLIIRQIDLTTLVQFYKQHHKTIYKTSDSSSAFLDSSYTEQKHRFYEVSLDCFGFYQDEQLIGVYGGNLVDWSTYYIRYCAIIPEFQRGGMFQKILEYTLAILKRFGVERAIGDVSPSNLVTIHVFNKLKFNITGYQTSERWGSLLTYTKYLSDRHEDFFIKHFCAGIPHQLEQKSRSLYQQHDTQRRGQ